MAELAHHIPFAWEEPFMAAVLETNGADLPERMQLAEDSMLKRLVVLTSDEEDATELELLEKALKLLNEMERVRPEEAA